MIRARNDELGSLGCNLGSAWNSSKKKMKQNKTKNFGETSSRVHHDSRSVVWFIDVSTLAKTPLLLFQKPCFICFMSKRNLCLCSLAYTLLGVKLLASCSPERVWLQAAVGVVQVRTAWGTGMTSHRVPPPAVELVPCCGAGSLHESLKLAGNKEPNQNGSVGCFAAARLAPNTWQKLGVWYMLFSWLTISSDQSQWCKRHGDIWMLCNFISVVLLMDVSFEIFLLCSDGIMVNCAALDWLFCEDHSANW